MRRKDAEIKVGSVKCGILTTLLVVSPPMFVCFFSCLWAKIERSCERLLCLEEKHFVDLNPFEISISINV